MGLNSFVLPPGSILTLTYIKACTGLSGAAIDLLLSIRSLRESDRKAAQVRNVIQEVV